MTITVIGAGSMIAGALRTHAPARHWRFLPHAQALSDTAWARDSAVVVNLAFDPALKTMPYCRDHDIDRRLAALIAPGGARYVMASTRMAYGPAPDGGRLAETMAASPSGFYGTAKLRAEQEAAALLGPRLTVLRLSNIFDGTEAAAGRRSFFGTALRSLREQGCITFDMSPFVARDFLPARLAAAGIAAVAARPEPGLFNLGAGFAVPVGRIAQWLIEGHGGGALRVGDFREHDGFWLDMGRTRGRWSLPTVAEASLRDECVAIGRGLAAAMDLAGA